MIRRPPRSTPFPTRRSSDLNRVLSLPPGVPSSALTEATNFLNARIRSEEHTSELQSQSNLVCRLLLEKKKKKKQNIHILTIDRFSCVHDARCPSTQTDELRC